MQGASLARSVLLRDAHVGEKRNRPPGHVWQPAAVPCREKAKQMSIGRGLRGCAQALACDIASKSCARARSVDIPRKHRARPSRLQGDEYVAASRSGAQARCQLACMGRWRRDLSVVTLGAPLSTGPPPAGGDFLARALSRYLRKAGYPPAARTSLLFAPIKN